MVVTTSGGLRKQIVLQTQDKKGHLVTLYHQDHLKLLGIPVSCSLKWDHLITGCHKSLKIQLTSRLAAVKMIARFSKPHFTRILDNGQVNSKFIYGLEVWGQTTKTNLRTVQAIQNQTARLALGPQSTRTSDKQTLSKLKWDNVQEMATKTVLKLIQKILVET